MTNACNDAENNVKRRTTRSARGSMSQALWTEEETRALVGVWGAEDVQSQLDGVARNKAIFEKIASSLANHGYNRTWQQCKTKIKNLIQKYRKVSLLTYKAIEIGSSLARKVYSS